jgi:YD repeat-containing protein
VCNLRVAILGFSLMAVLSCGLLAYGQGTTQYIYDANGRLTGVIAPNGEAAIYRYDPAGNLTSIEHIGAGGFGVLSFSPQVGTIGDQVTFVGVGMDTASSVSFNGTPAQIVSATPGSLIALVPDGATTGLITLSGVRGTTATATAFVVVARVVISPSLAETLPGESIGFSATVVGTPDQRVTWAVNGTDGGSASTGTIDRGGNYTAPDINTGLTVTISATSVVDTAVSSQATARILNPNTSSEVRSALVSVGVGLSQNTNFTSAPVSIQVGAPLGIASPLVSVLEGNLLSVQSQALTVELGQSLAISSQTVSAEIGEPLPVFSSPVSTTNGPVITAISPATLIRGATVTVTITGQNLAGATGVSWVNPNGNLEQNIGVTSFSASADGTTLNFTAAVSTSAVVGTDVVYVSTATGRSANSNLGINTVAIQ